MRVIRHVVLAVVVMGLSGCIPVFLHPGYTSNEVVVESRLEGTWAQPGNERAASLNDTLTFRPDKDRAWRVVLRNGGTDPDSRARQPADRGVRQVMRQRVPARIDLRAVPIAALRSSAGWIPLLAAITDAGS